MKVRISRWSEEEGRERRERFVRKNSRESKRSQLGSRKYCDTFYGYLSSKVE